MRNLEHLLDPKVIALIGATDREGSVGRSLMENLLRGKEERKIYFVNPKRESAVGEKCWPSIASVPDQADLAIVGTPAETVPQIVEECGQAGVGAMVIISAGFREAGESGQQLEKEIAAISDKYGMRILGPNCLGIIRPHTNLNATFLRRNPEPGRVAFISQSGALGSAILDWAVSSHIGFSTFVFLGSMLDVDFGDLIDFLGEDPLTRSIIIYMESVGNARKFMRAARGFARNKPIIVIKPGKYPESARAALSHTGAMAGSYDVYNAAFKRAGVVPVHEIMDLFNCASVLDSRFLPAGVRIAIVTNAGGPGVIAADAVRERGGELSQLSKKTIAHLDSFLPSYWSHTNPVDVLGDADLGRFINAVNACLSDPSVDGIIVVYTPQGAASPTELAEAVATVAEERIKPILTVWMGEDEVRAARQLFYSKGIPTYSSPEAAIRTYMYMSNYKRNLDLLYETPEELSVGIAPPSSHLKLLARRALEEGNTVLTEDKADKFIDAYGIPRAGGTLCTSVEHAASVAHSMRYPVVLKIVSPDVIHKADAGGVITGIHTEAELREAFSRIMSSVREKSPEAKIEGIYVQRMITGVNHEVILGSKKDGDFGSVILFGSGGIGVEVFRDFSIGLPPLNQILARRMMEDTRVWEVLKSGLRIRPPANLRLLEEIIVKFSNLVVDFPEIAEIDINPLAVCTDGIYALDSRIILDPQAADDEDLHRHLVIMPYPVKYITPWRLKDGTEVLLRPIRPEDEPMEAELISGLSEETSRFRFFQPIRNITHEMLVRYCNIDYDREMAIIAEYTKGRKKRNIGVGRLITEPGEKRAEFAVVVADDFQGQGLGKKLVDVLIGIGEEKGLESIYGIVLPDNTKMIVLCRALGFEIKRADEEIVVELRLRSQAES
ncbi:MAG: acetyl-CoA synthetase [Dehalococcoidia bacterium SM23_28_2]|nr:MAG: acetyl-CoA synthetase [Dehalococcoidia bacterium SM23_28_2]